MTMNRADAYDAAANYLDAHGWYQGDYFNGAYECLEDNTVKMLKNAASSDAPPAMCMAGAMGVYMETNEWDTDAERLFHLFGTHIANWNDDPIRTKEDVTGFLRLEATRIRMGNIGDNPREYEFQPMPETVPVVEPAAPQPVKEPQPA